MAKKKAESTGSYELYLKITDKTGSTHISYHQVWDGARFFESVLAQQEKEGGRVEVSSREDWLQSIARP